MPLRPIKIRSLSRDEVRGIDATAAQVIGLPTLVLMENAGRGAAELLKARIADGTRVLVLCGPGNNGGDGAVVARHLNAWGVPVRVVWLADPSRLTGDAATQFTILERSGLNYLARPSDLPDQLAIADWVVDGLFGTGLTRPLEGTYHEIVEAINRSKKPVLALDIPSGLDADTGEPLGVAVRAKLTATFVSTKHGFLVEGASDYLGEVHVVEIGVPRRVLQPFEG